MVVTTRLLLEGQTGTGGFTKAQVECLGVPWPLKTGWKQRVIGSEISDEMARKFVALKTPPREDPRQMRLFE